MKFKELKAINEKDLDNRLASLELELIKLRAQVSSDNNPKSSGQIKKIRRTIAQIKTIKNE